uniref:Uncharacterized protein n=1 Tax=Pyxicephalus adspersus TaxID=30357 RepID=A0AAV2ZL71_PYXAD|nr:TPA: hypothetical protein GDO54_004209 [Pyxicephalus adspersus]
MYEIGYLVALAIGLLFIILMTLVGLFFACCRCCGKCGGKMYQKQTKRMTCKRRFLYFFLLIITLIILAGDICAFYSNSKTNSAVNNSFTTFNNTLDNLKTYINTVPQDVDIIVNSSSVPIDKANNSVIGIGPILGGRIKRSIELQANVTLDTVQNMVNVLNDTAKALVNVNDTFNTLNDLQSQLVKNLTDVQTAIIKTLTDCGSPCSGAPSPNDLVIDANFNAIPDFSSQLKTINEFLNSGIDGTISDARQVLNDIPQAVTNQSKSSVQSVQNQLKNIKQKITDARSNIPIVDKLDSVNSYFNIIANEFQKYKPEVEKYEYYRWIVGICLSCIILLVVVCNLFGLLLGPWGHKSNVDPTDRSCASNSGGDFLMAGAGLSFIFAWLLMLITAILFAVGGNAYTSFCKPWGNQQLYQYTSDVNSTLENTNIKVNNISFLSPDQKNQVTSVSKSGIDTLDFSNITQQTSKNITRTNLTGFANQLKSIAAKLPSGNASKAELENEANTLLGIQASIDANLLPQVKKINISVTNLQATATKLPSSLNDTLKAIDDAQKYVDTEVVAIVKNLTTQLARCGPVASAMDSAEVLACQYIVDTLNAFWFSIGWCTIFFLPSIILSVKLAKYYRRMKTSDVYE